MKVKLLGVRGSLPAPARNLDYRKKIRRLLQGPVNLNNNEIDFKQIVKNLPIDTQYIIGGNTTCVTVTSGAGNLYIIDCGSGIRPLGDSLMSGECGKGEGNLSIFITHTHWDHIQGLPFFKPVYIPGNRLNFFSACSDLKERLEKQMDSSFFPVPFSATGSEKKFNLLKPDETIEPEEGLTIDCFPLKHPGGSFAFRFREKGKTFIFATDAEFTGEDLEKTGNHTDFFLNADLLILDSQYTLDESFNKFDWGHTSYTIAVNCGIRWGVKNLVLTHHEPSYDDSKLMGIYKNAVEHRNSMDLTLPKIFLAIEGTSFLL